MLQGLVQFIKSFFGRPKEPREVLQEMVDKDASKNENKPKK